VARLDFCEKWSLWRFDRKRKPSLGTKRHTALLRLEST